MFLDWDLNVRYLIFFCYSTETRPCQWIASFLKHHLEKILTGTSCTMVCMYCLYLFIVISFRWVTYFSTMYFKSAYVLWKGHNTVIFQLSTKQPWIEHIYSRYRKAYCMWFCSWVLTTFSVTTQFKYEYIKISKWKYGSLPSLFYFLKKDIMCSLLQCRQAKKKLTKKHKGR